MLDNLRPSAASLPAKIMLLMLVLTFAVWGIGDILRSPGKTLTVATVGSLKVTAEDLARQLKTEGERMKEALGDGFTPDSVKSPQLARKVLNKLINDRLVTLHAEEIGLRASDVDVVRRIRSIPVFQDDKGNFDKSLFESMLRKNNQSEAAFAERLRRDMNVSFLINTLSWRAPVADQTYATFYELAEEGRNVTLYLLKPSMVPDEKAPQADTLKAYYDAHAVNYMSPELRTASYVTLTRDNLPDDARIPEQALQDAYKERLDEFKKPELRHVEQLLYSNEESAKKAHELLKQGRSIEQVGNETGVLNKKALSLGKVERKNIFENAAEKVFSLEKGQFTDPVQSPFGWHIFHVSGIEASKTLSFEEAKPLLEKEASAHYADKLLFGLVNKFQDALAGGSTFAEAAREFGLTISAAGPFDARGMTVDNTRATLPEFNNFVELVFKTDEKSETQAGALKGGGYFIAHVDNITPERQRAFDEVKGRVASDVKTEAKQKKLAEMSVEISSRFADPSSRREVLARYNLRPEHSSVIKVNTRKVEAIVFPEGFIRQVFSLKAKAGSKGHLMKTGEYLFATVDSIVPAPNPEGDLKLTGVYKQVRKAVNSRVRDEILLEYTHYLSTRYPVKIDDSALAAVLE